MEITLCSLQHNIFNQKYRNVFTIKYYEEPNKQNKQMRSGHLTF